MRVWCRFCGKMEQKATELHNMKRIKIHQITEDSLHLGLLLAMVGGYLDAYTFVGRGGVFANAQTGNIVLLGIYAAQGIGRAHV